MKRRTFLKALLAGTAVATVAPAVPVPAYKPEDPLPVSAMISFRYDGWFPEQLNGRGAWLTIGELDVPDELILRLPDGHGDLRPVPYHGPWDIAGWVHDKRSFSEHRQMVALLAAKAEEVVRGHDMSHVLNRAPVEAAARAGLRRAELLERDLRRWGWQLKWKVKPAASKRELKEALEAARQATSLADQIDGDWTTIEAHGPRSGGIYG